MPSGLPGGHRRPPARPARRMGARTRRQDHHRRADRRDPRRHRRPRTRDVLRGRPPGHVCPSSRRRHHDRPRAHRRGGPPRVAATGRPGRRRPSLLRSAAIGRRRSAGPRCCSRRSCRWRCTPSPRATA